jgi:hypothetical protein
VGQAGSGVGAEAGLSYGGGVVRRVGNFDLATGELAFWLWFCSDFKLQNAIYFAAVCACCVRFLATIDAKIVMCDLAMALLREKGPLAPVHTTLVSICFRHILNIHPLK